MFENENAPPIEVPYDAISEDALKGLIDSFILREGTDYGKHEAAHQTKYDQIYKQITKGDVKIVFDPNIGSITLINKIQWQKFFGN
ncbi:MAG: YheU family protein [Bdellovibrionales bacterium]|nr:YheU family protein [Bdellovibrionales bacterium]